MTRQNAGEQSHTCSRIPAVDDRGRAGKAHRGAMYYELSWAILIRLDRLTYYAKALHCPQSVEAIFTREVIANSTGAIRETCNDRGPMRDALVAGHREFGGKTASRMNR